MRFVRGGSWVGRVGIDDNFFEFGGDSIVSIQLVSRARRHGLSITPRAVFQHQTVEALAAVAGPLGAVADAGSLDRLDAASGRLTATPIMRWLQQRGGPFGRFSQSMLLELPAGVREEHLRTALQALLDHHDALRLRLGDGLGPERTADWSLEIAPPGAVAAGRCLRRVDVGGLVRSEDGGAVAAGGWDAGELRAAMAAEMSSAEGRLDPAAGLMVQAVWFDAGAERRGRLWLSIHHLAVDGVSWRILLPDLEAAWRQASTGQPMALPARSTSFRRWGELLASHARADSVRGELSFWREVSREPWLRLADGTLDAERDTQATAGHMTLTLPVSVTQALLTRCRRPSTARSTMCC